MGKARAEMLEALKAEIAAREQPSGRDRPAFSTGMAALDAHLPGGGLVPGALHEVRPGGEDAPHEAAAALFCAALLSRRPGPALWILSRRTLFPPALAETGLGPDRVIYAETHDEAAVLAVAEEALRHGGLAGVIAETARLSLTASRRLQLCAEETGTPCLALRRLRRGRPLPAGNAAATRWSVRALPSEGRVPQPRWALSLERCRGGRPAAFLVELAKEDGDEDAPRRLRLVAPLADRTAGADARRAAA